MVNDKVKKLWVLFPNLDINEFKKNYNLEVVEL